MQRGADSARRAKRERGRGFAMDMSDRSGMTFGSFSLCLTKGARVPSWLLYVHHCAARCIGYGGGYSETAGGKEAGRRDRSLP